MTKRQKPDARGQEDKAERLRQALRENLKKRKAQARARKGDQGQESSDG